MTDPFDDDSFDLVDWTPKQCSDELTRLHTLLARAEIQMRAVRREKKTAEYALRVARAKAMFSTACPKVGRGLATVDERNAWLDEATDNEQLELMNADILFENGVEYMRRLDRQLGAVQSIQKNMLATYTGATGRGG